MPNLEVKVRGKVRIGNANASDHLAFRHSLLLPHVGAI